ncbi:MAG: rhomboid family intramembrane serine protease [Sedimentisphaerales bacterium]
MFIPYAVDAPFDHQPVVNWLAILGIILVFTLQLVTSEKQVAEKPENGIESPIEKVIEGPIGEKKATEKQAVKRHEVTGPMARFALNGWGIGLFTYSWLHGGILKGIVRLIGNLIFLWPFGNAVCAKLGNKLYLLVYLGFGLLAGVTHLMLGSWAAVGACGAISGIVGMYIVLFPEDTISCLFLLPRPMAVSISGSWVVVLWFIFDLLEAGLGSPGTTYYAHILCVGAGSGLAVLMLKEKWLVMEKDEKSLLQLLSRNEKEEEQEKKEKKGKKEDKEEERKELETIEKRPETAIKEKAEPKITTAHEAKRTEDDFIHFKCGCGHKIKVYKKDAGKTGKCPKCLKWVEAPRG